MVKIGRWTLEWAAAETINCAKVALCGVPLRQPLFGVSLMILPAGSQKMFNKKGCQAFGILLALDQMASRCRSKSSVCFERQVKNSQ